MILSHKYKFIFIKTYKTAGTSIETDLSQYVGEFDVVTPIFPPLERHKPRNYKFFFNPIPELVVTGFDLRSIWKTLRAAVLRDKYYNHIPAYKLQHRVSENIWNTYYKFCVERNPWDKTLSHYHWINHNRRKKQKFSGYLKSGDFCYNSQLYTTKKSEKLLVDRVLRYENINDELADVFDLLGIPFSGMLNTQAKASTRKDKRNYREVFSKSEREIIAKAFKTEIEMHGYQF